MKNMRRLLLAAAAVVILAAGCGSSDNISYDPGLSPEEELQLDEIAEVPTKVPVKVPAETITPTPTPTKEPTETPAPTEVPPEEPTPQPIETPTPTPDPWDVKTVGEKLEGENVVRMLLVNRTGLKINDFFIKDSSMADFAQDAMPEGDIFENEETRAVYYDTTNALKDAQEKASGAQTAENQGQEAPAPAAPTYDFKLVFEDQSAMILHSVPFGDTDRANIRIEDNTAYLIFESKALKKQVNTLNEEKAARNIVPTAAPAAEQPRTENTGGGEDQTADRGGDNGGDTGNNGGDIGNDGGDIGNDGGDDYDDTEDDYDDGSDDSSDDGSSDISSDSGSDSGSESESSSSSSDSGSGDYEDLDVYSSSSGSESLDVSGGDSSDLDVSSDGDEGSGSEDAGGDEESLLDES